MKFAAIDIGSNAVRLLLSRIIENGSEPIFKKESLIRIPIRLGEDSFTQQRISEEKKNNLIKTMIGFKHLIEAYEAVDYIACATSAMREAVNGKEIAELIKQKSGINLEIIDGKREAYVINSNHIEKELDASRSYLYIDVGGGSTELTLFSNNESITSRSFDIGTVRLLKDLVYKESWKQMKKWIKESTAEFQPISGIGSGGNINKIFRLSRKNEGKPLSLKNIKDIYQYLSTFTLDQRIKILGLKPDRADVILPAAEIYLSVMKWARIKRMYVPQIGLSDGLIHILYERQKQNKSVESATV
jgi:exopolyphosphatase / guanosine-5'-triphosphate,3'-diphosphate pyrophosphatase